MVRTPAIYACLLFATLGTIAVGCGGGSNKSATTPPAPEQEAKAEPPASEPAAPSSAPAPQKTLYERLGGERAIAAVVDEFVNRTTGDARIKDRFFNVDANNLKRLL